MNRKGKQVTKQHVQVAAVAMRLKENEQPEADAVQAERAMSPPLTKVLIY